MYSESKERVCQLLHLATDRVQILENALRSVLTSYQGENNETDTSLVQTCEAVLDSEWGQEPALDWGKWLVRFDVDGFLMTVMTGKPVRGNSAFEEDYPESKDSSSCQS